MVISGIYGNTTTSLTLNQQHQALILYCVGLFQKLQEEKWEGKKPYWAVKGEGAEREGINAY